MVDSRCWMLTWCCQGVKEVSASRWARTPMSPSTVWPLERTSGLLFVLQNLLSLISLTLACTAQQVVKDSQWTPLRTGPVFTAAPSHLVPFLTDSNFFDNLPFQFMQNCHALSLTPFSMELSLENSPGTKPSWLWSSTYKISFFCLTWAVFQCLKVVASYI